MTTPTATLAVPLRSLAASVLLHAAVGAYALVHVTSAGARADWAGSRDEVAAFQLAVRAPEPALEPLPVAEQRRRDAVPALAEPEFEPAELGALRQHVTEVTAPPWQGAALPLPDEPQAPVSQRYRASVPPARTAEPAATPPARAPVAEPVAEVLAADVTDAAFVAASPIAGRNPQPRYPGRARRQGLQGTVTVALEVDTAGTVTAAEVATSSGHAVLDAEAVRCLALWRFEPARRGGVAVASRVERDVVFRLLP